MMIRGSCLCGAIRFELRAASVPFELRHCNRCRKVSGSAFMAGIGVSRSDFKWLCGEDAVTSYEAPLLNHPPAYRVCFCSTCGSPVPDPDNAADWFELPAGLLDNDPALLPDKHSFVEHKAPWHSIHDQLPQFNQRALLRHRSRKSKSAPDTDSPLR